jgi:hypothetical protein
MQLIFLGIDSVKRLASIFPARGTAAALAGFLHEVPLMSRRPAQNGIEPEKSEDDIQREQLGPRGVPGAPDPAKMTPQREKKTPENIDPGHTA